MKFGSTGGGGGGSLQTLSGDTGGVVTPSFSGNITIAGDGSILTTIGNLSFNTLTLELIPGTNGQLIIGSSSGYPEWANLTAGAGITITNGANSIQIACTNAAPTITGNSGGVVDPSVGGNFDIVGDGSLITSIGNLSANTLTFELVPGTNGQLIIGSSSGAPAWSTLTAGTGISITDGSHSIQIASTVVSPTLTGNSGGVVDPTVGGNFDVVGDGALITSVGNLSANTLTFELVPGTNGQVIIGSNSGAPAWATLTAGTGISITDGSHSIQIAATAPSPTITGNSGGVVDPSVGGNFDIVGDGSLLTSVGNLSANTLTFELVPGTNGQVIIGSSSGVPVWSTLTAGSNVTITNAANSITIAASGGGGGITWSDVTTGTVTLAAAHGYLMDDAFGVVATLPATAAIGDTYIIVGKNAGGWTIDQNSGQTIHFGNLNTTTTTGSLASTGTYDCIEIVCSTANTNFVVRSSVGNITVV